jgi:hypothetical protein
MGGWNSDVSGWGSDRGTVKNLFGDGTNTTLLHKEVTQMC